MESNRANERKYAPDYRLILNLLGTPRILMDGDPITIERHKATALLAFLAMTGAAHHRDMLADMFWPAFDRTRARAALRRALASLTRAVPGDWWVVDRDTLQFQNTSANTYIDVRAFRSLLCQYPLHDLPDNDLCKDCFDALTVAVQLYQADFMEGFTLGDCPGFDDWQFHQREELRRELIVAIEWLIHCHAGRDEYETAIRYGKRWSRMDPLDEKARMALMQLYLRAKQGNAALHEYEAYARSLQSELGVAPQGEIKQLYDSIKIARQVALPVSSPVLKPARGETAGQVRRVRPQTRSKNDQMVGREIEMELAEAEWQRALRGEPVVLVVRGEPGIGKSQLVRELKKKVIEDGGQALEGGCYPDGGPPYTCFSQVILQGLGRLHTEKKLEDFPGYILAGLARLAPEVLAIYPDISKNPRLDPQSEQNRYFDSFMIFCKTIIQTWQAPLLLILEDIHWADDGSLQLLRHLALRARIEKLKLMIVVTLRDTEVDLEAGSALRILLAELNQNGLSVACPLQPLCFEQTRDLMQVLFKDREDMVAGMVEAVHHHTEGNPYFVDELCRALIEDDQLREQFEADHLLVNIQIPATIREVILGRIKRLSNTAQRVLLQAAFLGQQFDSGMLFELCKMDDEMLIKALDEAEQAHLIRESNTLEGFRMTFAHILIPMVLRESLSGFRRRREHQRVADFLEVHAPEDANGLAYHFASADNRPKAIKYAQRAAQKAIELNVYEDALKHLRTALNLLINESQSETRLSVLEDYGDVYRLIGEGSQAVAVYQEAHDVWLSLSHRERWTSVRLRRKVGESVTNMNLFAEVQRLMPVSRASLEAGLASVKGEPAHPEKVRLLATLSRDAWYMRSQIDWTAAEGYATQAVEIAEELDQPVEISVALEALATVYGLKGMLSEQVELCQRRLELSFDPRFTDLKERVNIYLQTGMAFYDVGEYLLALERFREAESLGRQIWDIPKQADALVRQGKSLFRLDRWNDLLAIETRIRDLQSRFTYKRMGVLTCFFYAIQSAVYTWRGKLGLGEQLKVEAHEVMLSVGGSEQNWARNQHF